jgi:hypothetical protein
MKWTGTKWKFWSLTASGGSIEGEYAAALFCRCPGVQQSIGHFSSLSPMETDCVGDGASAM